MRGMTKSGRSGEPYRSRSYTPRCHGQACPGFPGLTEEQKGDRDSPPATGEGRVVGKDGDEVDLKGRSCVEPILVG